MPGVLNVSTTGNEDFTGTTGASFTLDMVGPVGSGLVVVSGSYAGATVTAAPFTFKVASGTNILFLHFEAFVPGVRLQVVENFGAGSRQILETLFFDPANPGTGFEIRGV